MLWRGETSRLAGPAQSSLRWGIKALLSIVSYVSLPLVPLKKFPCQALWLQTAASPPRGRAASPQRLPGQRRCRGRVRRPSPSLSRPGSGAVHLYRRDEGRPAGYSQAK